MQGYSGTRREAIKFVPRRLFCSRTLEDRVTRQIRSEIDFAWLTLRYLSSTSLFCGYDFVLRIDCACEELSGKVMKKALSYVLKAFTFHPREREREREMVANMRMIMWMYDCIRLNRLEVG